MIAPVVVSLYLGGYVATARLLRRHALAKIAAAMPAPWGETQGECVIVSIFWPIWLPIYWLGLGWLALWPVLIRALFGDVG